MNTKLRQTALAISLGLCFFSAAHGRGVTDLVATTASALILTDQDPYLGFSATSGQPLVTHGINGVFHSKLLARYDAYITISADDQWTFQFAAPRQVNDEGIAMTAPLQKGFYDNATGYPFNELGRPGLSVSVNALQYNTVSGWFNVLDVSYDPAGQINALAIDFAQHGNNETQSGPALYGSLRFNSPIPLTTSVPEASTALQWAIGLAGLGWACGRRGRLA